MHFISPTYGDLTLKQTCDKMLAFYRSHKDTDRDMQIIIGSDSQSYSTTKMVTCIAVICKGNGGIFFYQIDNLDRIKDVRTKLYVETQRSLQVTDELIDLFEEEDRYHDMYLSVPMAVHIDAGNSDHGKTKELIPELVGWVKGLHPDVDAATKPDSFVASSIADKISK